MSQTGWSDGRRADVIELRGLRALGVHGVLPEEQHRAQPFEVDVILEVDLRRAGRSDALADTVDYGAVGAAVAAVFSGPHAALLEHLAERVAAAVLTAGAPLATAVTVKLRKTRPPVPFELASAGVTIHRRRDDLAS
jgi:7,8-dihydroneopterin aldolase/epimerase/oxygenase